MTISVSSIFGLARYTVQSPRAAARSLINMQLPDSARWLLLGLVAATSALLTLFNFTLIPVDQLRQMSPETVFAMRRALENPILTAVFQAIFLLFVVICVHRIGRWQGGNGSFSDALLLTGWLQIVLIGLQVGQIVALLVLPPLAEVLGLAGLVLSFWLLSHFVAELHGFKSAGKVFVAIVGVIVGVAVALSVLLVAVVGIGG
jgi:hypothetical protein